LKYFFFVKIDQISNDSKIIKSTEKQLNKFRAAISTVIKGNREHARWTTGSGGSLDETNPFKYDIDEVILEVGSITMIKQRSRFLFPSRIEIDLR